MAAEGNEFAGQKIAFVGGGVMAGAMIHALIHAGKVTAQQIRVGEPVADRRAELAGTYGVTATADNLEAVRDADIVVLSVKPQVLPRVMPGLCGHIRPTALVLSIVAGMPIVTIRNGLRHAAIVRVMPNTPAQIGEGITVWT